MVQISLWFLYFIIYSVLGWIVETLYCSVLNRRFVERGFLWGPLCPIYGTGALILLVVLKPVENWLLIFLIGFFLTSALEYATSYVMEKIFNMRWWDYSERFLNLNGRVCLLNSTFFAILALVLTKVLHPFVAARAGLLSHSVLYPLAGFCLILLLVDFIISVHAGFRLKNSLEKLREAQDHLKEELSKHQREIKEHLLEGKEDLLEQLSEGREGLKESWESRKETLIAEGRERIHELRLRLTASERYILRSFPALRPLKKSLALQLEGLKEELRKAKDRGRML